ncbi:MAG TPA: hypothetical protein VIX42_11830 [Edaphobacter sp.]
MQMSYRIVRSTRIIFSGLFIKLLSNDMLYLWLSYNLKLMKSVA